MPIATAIALAVAVTVAACTAVGLVDEWQELAQRLQILHQKPCNASIQSVILTVRSRSESHALWGRCRLTLSSNHPSQLAAAESGGAW